MRKPFLQTEMDSKFIFYWHKSQGSQGRKFLISAHLVKRIKSILRLQWVAIFFFAGEDIFICSLTGI